jgi:hypothetical protein
MTSWCQGESSKLQQLSFPLLVKPALGYGKGWHAACARALNGEWDVTLGKKGSGCGIKYSHDDVALALQLQHHNPRHFLGPQVYELYMNIPYTPIYACQICSFGLAGYGVLVVIVHLVTLILGRRE